jgi:prephenate dehydrogenase (NADP+)
MMLEGGNGGDEEKRKFKERVEWARQAVFGDVLDNGVEVGGQRRRPILLSEDILDRFSLGKRPEAIPERPSPGTVPPKYRPNSHLSLLAMVDSWAHLSINPYTHLSLAATPIFRLFLGVAEYLFLSPTALSSAIHSALFDTWHRSDDLEFVVAARGWSQCVSLGNFDVYRRRFEETRMFFESRFEEANRVGGEMIKAIMESEVKRESSEESQ